MPFSDLEMATHCRGKVPSFKGIFEGVILDGLRLNLAHVFGVVRATRRYQCYEDATIWDHFHFPNLDFLFFVINCFI